MTFLRQRQIRRLLVVSLLLAASAAGGSEAAWTPLGPDGGDVRALAVDPEAGSLYAGTRAGVFKSTDGGAHWSDTSGDLPGFDGPAQGIWVNALAVDAGGAVYASVLLHGVFKSTDGGSTWQVANTGLVSSQAEALIAHAQVGGTVYASTAAGIFRTTNAGEEWTRLPRFPIGVVTIEPTALAVDPVSTSTLYAGLPDGLVKTVNGGATWAHSGSSEFGGWRIDALAVHPAASGTVFAAAAFLSNGSAGVWRSENGGATWTSASAGLPAGRITALAIPPAAPQSLYAAVFGAGVFKSLDGGRHWERASDALSHVVLRGLVPDPTAGGTLYAAGESTEWQGVFKSTDGGGSWTPASHGITAFALESLVVDPQTPTTLYTAPARGVLKSTDAGQSWHPVNQGLTYNGTLVSVRELAIGADPRVLFAAADYHLYKTVDGGLHWALVGTPGYGAVGLLEIDPEQPRIVLAATADGLFRSIDGGATWGPAEDDFGSQYVAVADIVRDPASPAVLYASTAFSGWPESCCPDLGLYQSIDRGATWALLAEGHFGRLAIDPRAPSTLYATGFDKDILKSTDGGLHWLRVGTAPAYGSVLIIDPIAPSTLYLAADLTERPGVFRSEDGGATWTAWSAGLSHLAVSDLAFGTPGKLYAATRAGGLSTRITAVPAPCVPGPTELCLAGGRFRVEVAWRTLEGATGPGRTLPLTDDTGAFWFFDDGNLELMVKVLDGRALNGRFWVFFGSLTNVEFTLTVTDTATLRQRTYRNPPNTMASRGDTDAF